MKRSGIEEFEFARLLSFVVSFINPRYGPPEKVMFVIKEFARLFSFVGSFINPRFMLAVEQAGDLVCNLVRSPAVKLAGTLAGFRAGNRM